MKTTWILIANSSEARLFKAEKSHHNMQLIKQFSHPESRDKIVNLVADVPGRYRKNGNAPKSTFEEASNPKKVEAERFAHELANELNKGRTNNLYTNIILIAPSHFQGLLNKYCNIHVHHLIQEAIDKDYTKVKQHQLDKFLDGKIRLRQVA